MTPQTNFMIVAAIVPEHEATLRQLLASMNDAPGRVNANNALIPFAQFDTLHVARLLILDDQTTADIRIHGEPVTTYPLYFALLGDIDGTEDAFLDRAGAACAGGLARTVCLLRRLHARYRSACAGCGSIAVLPSPIT